MHWYVAHTFLINQYRGIKSDQSLKEERVVHSIREEDNTMYWCKIHQRGRWCKFFPNFSKMFPWDKLSTKILWNWHDKGVCEISDANRAKPTNPCMWNCKQKQECFVPGRCLTDKVVHQATDTVNDENQKRETYPGLTTRTLTIQPHFQPIFGIWKTGGSHSA